MIYTIQSELLQVSIKQKGMELCSIKNRIDEKEYLWQGNPSFWTGQAPILFPIIGLLKDNSTMIHGKEFAIPKHGIVRHSEQAVVKNHTSDSITFQLTYDEHSLLVYPFKFVLEITFSLEGKKLLISHCIQNEGTTNMPFHLGGHPAFNCPVNKDISYAHYFIEFENKEHSVSWLLNEDGLITDHSKPIFDSSSILRLNDTLFDEDALIFRDLKSSSATLKNDLVGEILRVDFEDFPNLGIWAKPKAPYVCIEPWIGIADHVDSNREFISKERLIILDAGAEKEISYSISIY